MLANSTSSCSYSLKLYAWSRSSKCMCRFKENLCFDPTLQQPTLEMNTLINHCTTATSLNQVFSMIETPFDKLINRAILISGQRMILVQFYNICILTTLNQYQIIRHRKLSVQNVLLRTNIFKRYMSWKFFQQNTYS